jgi:hypothetical protein
MSRIFKIDDIWDYINDTNSEFDNSFDDVSTSFSRASSAAPSTTPSTTPTASTISLDNDQPHTTKKRKLYRSKRKYCKTSWVWKYMIQENEFDICQVPVINLRN